MIETFSVTIPELTGDKERKAYVYLPVGYGEKKKYPVMYMFDGHNLFDDGEATFGRSWRLADYLDFTRTQIIIAAVECNHEENKRLEEYSPVDFYDRDGSFIKAHGKQYMHWLIKKFKPLIDKRYKTASDREHTAIGGSSMGGLMTLYALSRYNRTFSKGAALSPSLWVGGGEVPQFFKKAKYGKDTVIYTDYGSKELANHSFQQEVFAECAQRMISKGVYLTARIVPGGTHCEACREKCIPFFMNVLGFEPEN